jgi:hypothetical protein
MTERGTVFIYEHASTLEELRQRVAQRVRQGWKPHGDPVEVVDPAVGRGDTRRYSQAVFKYYLEPMPPVLPHRFLLTAR